MVINDSSSNIYAYHAYYRDYFALLGSNTYITCNFLKEVKHGIQLEWVDR